MKYSFEENIIGHYDEIKGQCKSRNLLVVTCEACGFSSRNPIFKGWWNSKLEVFLDRETELFEACNTCGAQTDLWNHFKAKKVKRIVPKAIDGLRILWAYKVYVMVLDDRHWDIVDSDKMLYLLYWEGGLLNIYLKIWSYFMRLSI